MHGVLRDGVSMVRETHIFIFFFHFLLVLQQTALLPLNWHLHPGGS